MSTNRAVERGAMRLLPYMGVIWVVAEAEKLGFYNGHPDWCNLGQGQPEVGDLEGAPPRYDKFELEPIDHAYGPIHGTVELRERIADHYNRLYRQGRSSLYTADNVAVASGGRLALTRAMCAVGDVKVGYQIPDYTAYEDMFGVHLSRITPVPVMASEENGFAVTAGELGEAIDEHALRAFLISNPCNPTGRVIRGEELDGWVSHARERDCLLLMDEFYSHFIYENDGTPASGGVSSAAHVEDVDKDPVLIFDGLTKNFRYPGWRVGWVVGPRDLIECQITAGSSIDGGPGRPVQRAAMEILEPQRCDRELQAVRSEFVVKRNLMIDRLKAMGVRFARESESTFYAWGCLDGLPAPFNDSHEFFKRALEHKVMTVPGPFFDIDPEGVRGDDSPFASWMRFSFGPPRDNVEMGLDRLASMLAEA